MSLNRNIQKYRQQRDLSQHALAVKCNITPSYIALLETGRRKNPSMRVLENIATALGVSVNDLIQENSKQ